MAQSVGFGACCCDGGGCQYCCPGKIGVAACLTVNNLVLDIAGGPFAVGDVNIGGPIETTPAPLCAMGLGRGVAVRYVPLPGTSGVFLVASAFCYFSSPPVGERFWEGRLEVNWGSFYGDDFRIDLTVPPTRFFWIPLGTTVDCGVPIGFVGAEQTLPTSFGGTVTAGLQFFEGPCIG